MTFSVRNWASSEGGWIARSLGQGLQLPKDVHYFSSGSDEALATWLQWHSIAVAYLTCLFYLLFFHVYIYIYIYIYFFFTFYFLLFFGIIIDIVITSSVIGLHDGRQIEGCYRAG